MDGEELEMDSMPKKLSEITRNEWIRYQWVEIQMTGEDRTFLQTGERTPDEAAQAKEDWDYTAEERGKAVEEIET